MNTIADAMRMEWEAVQIDIISYMHFAIHHSVTLIPFEIQIDT